MKMLEKTIDIGGQTLKLQFGKYARATTSSVLATLGETTVLVAITAGKKRDDLDYFPLQVEYVERLYAGGIIKGSQWVKREGRPTDEAILKGRLIDRSIRPLFPKNYKRDVQIIITLMATDNVNSPELLAAIATSAALHVSSIPWKGPISTLRMGYNPEDKKFLLNPSMKDIAAGHMDLVASTSRTKVLMIETKGMQVDEEIVEEGLKQIKAENNKIIDFIESLRKEIGMDKEEVTDEVVDKKIATLLKSEFADKLDLLVKEKAAKEFGESPSLGEVINAVAEKLGEDADKKMIASAIDYLTKEMIRMRTLDTKIRIDGRKPDEIRKLSSAVGILARTHGTGLFERGDTQVLSVATLGSPSLEQHVEGPEGQETKSYIHHYSFPPYSVGETGRIGSVSRREIGHGALAEKAIEPVLPSLKDFPYTIRVVSEVMTSNGSTSMASTCGSSLALMDAGVPLKAAVAGIAMGIMSRSDDDYVILTDIMGIEDFSGEMDFKVTGTTTGITAIQLDVKNEGLTDTMVTEILAKAKVARMAVLDTMNSALAKPREQVSVYAPKVMQIMIPPGRIGEVIGPGGKVIRALSADFESEINIEEDGAVTITGIDFERVKKCAQVIKDMTREVEIGEVFTGEVMRIMAFGAFVEVLPGKEGLVHVSKMGVGFVKSPEDVVHLGEMVQVKVIEIDSQGRINLQMISKPETVKQSHKNDEQD